MKLLDAAPIRTFFSRTALFCAIFFVSTLSNTHAAELITFEQAGCSCFQAFDREVAPIYSKTTEGQRAPLWRVNIDRPLPPDLPFIEAKRLAPFFALVENAHEIGRIRGDPGADSFWGCSGC